MKPHPVMRPTSVDHMTHQENGRIDGPLVVDDDLVLNGMATGPITVQGGGSLLLHGTASAGLDVQPGGRATIGGVLHGTLRCSGAVELLGVIEGAIIIESGGTVLAAEGAHRRDLRGKSLVMGPSGAWEPATQSTYSIDDGTKRWPVSSD